MTETQQEIIEIIEPYMDKTLSFGCIIEYHDINNWNIIIEYWKILEKNFYLDYEVLWYFNYKWWYWVANYWKTKLCPAEIIWHYDITVVLKYIEDKLWVIEYRVYKDNIVYDYNNIDIILPNKPLHIYTEEENKDLLKLLKKLWTQKQ